MKTLRSVLILAVIITSALSSMMFAQDYIYATGNPTFGVNIPLENGFIDVSNGEVHLEITLAAHAQRGSLQLSEQLVYDSRIWKIVANGSSYGWQPTNVPNSMAGWRFTTGLESGTTSYSTSSVMEQCDDPVSQQVAFTKYTGFKWTDPSGTVHVFPVVTLKANRGFCIDQDPQLSDTPSGSGYAVDGSGYFLQVTNITSMVVYDSNGNEVYPQKIDRNGNYFSQDANGNLIDTLGRTPVITTTNGNQTYYDVLTYQGGRARYTVTTETINVNTSFGQSAVSEYAGALTAIQSIELPDGTYYRFNYDTGTASGYYGELTSIGLPTGGTVSLTYNNFLDSYQNENRWLTNYSGGKGSLTFSPQVVTQCTGSQKVGCQERTSVLDGVGNETVYTLTLNNGAWNTSTTYVQFQGTYGNPMSTVTNYDFSNSCGDTYCTGAMWVTASSQTTILNDTGQTSQTNYTYASPWTGKPTKVQTWDYYTGTAPSNPTKETDFTYGYMVNGAVFLTQQTAYQYRTDGSVDSSSQITYNYDETAPTATSGITQHQTVSGGGNVTSIIAGVGTTARTSATYDDTGAKLSDVDGRGISTGYLYACSNAYLSRTTYAVSVSGQPITTQTAYDCSSGLVASTTDPNSQTTTYSYDSIGRLASVSYPDGGGTSFQFPSATETDKTTKQTASSSIVQKTFLDGFGRSVQTATSAPEGTISSETTYDANGRAYCVSNPHSGASSSTDGNTCLNYDVLGRVTTQTQPDGNTISISYSGNSRTILDELQHPKKVIYDAFGRLTSVWEPNASGVLSYETDYKYNVFDKVTQVDQWGGASGSSGDRVRSFVYDSLGRMTSQTEPESGTTSFAYDGNGNLKSKTDARQLSVNFAYDNLNRVTGKFSSDGSLNYSYQYDGADGRTHTNPLGHLTLSANNVNAASAFSYDAMGRLTAQNYCLPADCSYSIAVGAQYDLTGNRTSLTYPDGRVVSQGFDTANRLSSVNYASWNGSAVNTSYMTVGSFAPPGEPTNATLGNGVQLLATFNNRSSVTSLQYDKTSQTISSKQYTWDKNAANLLQVTDVLDSTQTRKYAYDPLNRLVSVSGGGQVLTAPATSGIATLTISGTEQSGLGQPDCEYIGSKLHCGKAPTIYDGGTVTLTVNGHADAASYGKSDTAATLATNLGNAIQGDSSSPVGASVSGTTIALTARAAGASTNYSFNQSVAWDSSDFGSASFSASPASGNLTGGADAVYSGSGAINETYSYDPWGNMQQSGNFTFAQPSNTNNQIQGYSYDAAGNALSDGLGNTFAFDPNGLVQSSNGSVIYTYDADGNRVQKSGTNYVYFGGQLVATLSGGSWTDYLYAGGTLIGQVSGNQTAQATYRITDHLGSLRGDLDGSGNLTSSVERTPYGQVFQGSSSDKFLFAGLEYDSETGAHHATFRQYLPSQARWMSPDPYRGSYDWTNPQSLNRYAYVNGRPMLSTDPSGLCGDFVICVDVWAAADSGGNPFVIGAATVVGVLADIFGLSALFEPQFHGSIKPRPQQTSAPNKACNQTQAVDFLKAHQADAATVAKSLGVPTQNVLGLSGIESQWGASNAATQANNFFGLHGGQSAPFASGDAWYTSAGVQMSRFPSYLASAQSFAAQYGSAVQGVTDPTSFAQALVKAGFNPGKAPLGNPNFVRDTASTINSTPGRLQCP
jgi:RHS repeat-associated protein